MEVGSKKDSSCKNRIFGDSGSSTLKEGSCVGSGVAVGRGAGVGVPGKISGTGSGDSGLFAPTEVTNVPFSMALTIFCTYSSEYFFGLSIPVLNIPLTKQ